MFRAIARGSVLADIQRARDGVVSAVVFENWRIALRVHRDGDLWCFGEGADKKLLGEPLAARSTGDQVIVIGGHPVSEEWIAGRAGTSDQAAWVADWIAAELHEHVGRNASSSKTPRGPQAYRG